MRRFQIGLNLVILSAPFWLAGASLLWLSKLDSYLLDPIRLGRIVSVQATRIIGQEVQIEQVSFRSSPFTLIPNLLTLTGIHLFTGTGSNQKTFALADSVQIQYNLHSILFPSRPDLPLLDSLKIVHPHIYLHRGRKGNWNFENLIHPSTNPSRALVNSLTETNGVLSYLDRDLSPSLHAKMQAINGTLWFRPDNSLTFNLKASGIAGVSGPLQMEGSEDRQGSTLLALSLRTGNIQLKKVGFQFIPRTAGSITSGTGKGNAFLLLTRKPIPGSWKYGHVWIGLQSSLFIDHAGYQFPRQNSTLSGVKGSITLIGSSLHEDLNGDFAGAKTSVKSRLFNIWSTYQSSGPQLDIQSELQNVAYKNLIAALPISLSSTIRSDLKKGGGKGSITLRIAGPPHNYTASIQGRISQASFQKYHAESVQVHAFLADHQLTIEAKGKFAHGKAAAQARIGTVSGSPYLAEIHGSSMNLNILGIMFGLKMQGLGRVDLALQGKASQPPSVNAQAQISNLIYDHQRLASVYAHAALVHNRLQLKTLRVEDNKGFAAAQGIINFAEKRINVNVQGDELDIGAILRSIQHKRLPASPLFNETNQLITASTPLFDLNMLEGVGYLKGALTGSFHDPKLTGALNAFSLQAGKIGLDRLSALFTLSPQKLQIINGYADRYPGQISLQGLMDGLQSSDPGISITADAKQFDLPALLEELQALPQSTSTLLKPQQLIATLNTSSIQLGGTLKHIRLEHPVQLDLSNAAWNGAPITTASALVDYHEGTFDLLKSRVDFGQGAVSANGSIQSDGNINLAFTGQNLHPTDIYYAVTDKSEEDLDGKLYINGKISGKYNDIFANASITGDSLTFHELPIGKLQASLSYHNQIVQGQDISLTAPDAAVNLPPEITLSSITYNTQTKELLGAARLNGLKLKLLRSLFDALPYAASSGGVKEVAFLNNLAPTLSGSVSGTISVKGSLSKPQAVATLHGAGLQIGTHKIEKLEASAYADANGFRMPAPGLGSSGITINSGKTRLLLKTLSLEYGGGLQGDLSLYNVNLAQWASLIPGSSSSQTPPDVSGEGDMFINLSGAEKSPSLEISADLRNVLYNKFHLDRVLLSKATLAEPTLRFQGLTVTSDYTQADGSQGSLEAEADGSASFSWHSPYITQDSPFSLSINVPSQSLNALQGVAPSLKLRTDGSFTVAALIDRKSPGADVNTTGSLQLQAGSLQFGYQASNNSVRFFNTGLLNLKTTIRLDGSGIQVEPGAAAEVARFTSVGKPVPGTNSNLELSGRLPLNRMGSGAGIEIKTDKAPIYETPIPEFGSGQARGIASGYLRLTGSLSDLSAEGDIKLTDALGEPPNNLGVGTGSGFAMPVIKHIKIAVHLGKNVTVATSALNAQLEGELNLTGSAGNAGSEGSTSFFAKMFSSRPFNMHLSGDLSIIAGRITLPTARFTLVPPGSLRLMYPAFDPSQPDTPVLGIDANITAKSYLVLSSGNGFGPKRYEVTAKLRGPLSGLTTDPATGRSRLLLNFQTNPPDFPGGQQALQQQLAGAIGGTTLDQLSRNPGQAILQQVTSVITGSVLPSLFDQPAKALGFEELSLNYDPIQKFNFIVSRHIGGPLYVTYMRSLGDARVLTNLKASLRFTPDLQLSYQQDEFNTQTLLLETVFHF